jgi:hypothetical protein
MVSRISNVYRQDSNSISRPLALLGQQGLRSHCYLATSKSHWLVIGHGIADHPVLQPGGDQDCQSIAIDVLCGEESRFCSKESQNPEMQMMLVSDKSHYKSTIN